MLNSFYFTHNDIDDILLKSNKENRSDFQIFKNREYS